MLRRASVRWWSVLSVLAVLLVASGARANFVNFESGQVRPLALSPDGTQLFAVNTPDGRLEIFSLASGSPCTRRRCRSGSSGRGRAQRYRVWVVNHLSDSVSIVDPSSPAARRVARCRSATSRATSRSRDRAGRAFVTAAHRGQNHRCAAHDGVGRPGRRVGVRRGRARCEARRHADHDPEPLRRHAAPLAASPDGAIVHGGVPVGNRTTTVISEGAVCNGGARRLRRANVAGGIAGRADCRRRTSTTRAWRSPRSG